MSFTSTPRRDSAEPLLRDPCQVGATKGREKETKGKVLPHGQNKDGLGDEPTPDRPLHSKRGRGWAPPGALQTQTVRDESKKAAPRPWALRGHASMIADGPKKGRAYHKLGKESRTVDAMGGRYGWAPTILHWRPTCKRTCIHTYMNMHMVIECGRYYSSVCY